jgi:hypothetical protein
LIQLLGPALSATLMKNNLWIPFWIGIALYVLTLPAISLLSDTRTQHYQRDRRDSSTLVDSSDDSSVDTEDDLTEEEPLIGTSNARLTKANLRREKRDRQKGLLSRARLRVITEIRDFVKIFTSSANVGLCLVAFLVTTLAKSNINILIQYVSKRYNWTISQAAYLLSVKAGVNVFLYWLIIPAGLNYLVKHRSYRKSDANLFGAKTSLMLLLIGVIAIGFSFKIWMLISSK